MRHTCPDGQQTKLERHGPVGTMEGVTFTCPHCGYRKAATGIRSEAASILNRRFGTDIK